MKFKNLKLPTFLAVVMALLLSGSYAVAITGTLDNVAKNWKRLVL